MEVNIMFEDMMNEMSRNHRKSNAGIKVLLWGTFSL
jgi:hypothetical protein